MGMKKKGKERRAEAEMEPKRGQRNERLSDLWWRAGTVHTSTGRTSQKQSQVTLAIDMVPGIDR